VRDLMEAVMPPPSYFGERWPSGVCDEGVQVMTPVMEHCNWCQLPIEAGDQGTFITVVGLAGTYLAPLHRECQLRQIMGSVEHMEGRCHCRTGIRKEPQTPEEVRQDALALWAWIEARRQLDDSGE